MTRVLALVLAVIGAASPAAEAIALTVPVPVVRPGIPLPFQIRGTMPATLAFPVILRWCIQVGEDAEAGGEVTVEGRTQTLNGLGLVALPQRDLGPARLEISLVGDQGSGLVRLSAPLLSAHSEGQRLDAELTASTDPRERLDHELLAEWRDLWPIPTGAAIDQVRELLDKNPQQTAAGEDVLVDPVDDSVHPVRRHPGPGMDWAVVLRPETVLKRRWQSLAASAWTAAAGAGLGVVELYPAGDPTCTGINQHRALLIRTGLGRPLLVGIGAAQAGAEALYRRDPQLWGDLRLVAEESTLDAPAGWAVLPGTTAPVAETPVKSLALYAEGPFVIVVGTGEHDAAAADNARLGEAFRKAWASHAHGLPPLVTDREYRPAAWRHHRLVLIGSPASNGVLTDLAPTLPATWNDRGVLFAGRARTRQPPTFCAVVAQDPRQANQVVTVLDGTWPTTWATGLPLAQATVPGVLLPPGR